MAMLCNVAMNKKKKTDLNNHELTAALFAHFTISESTPNGHSASPLYFKRCNSLAKQAVYLLVHTLRSKIVLKSRPPH